MIKEDLQQTVHELFNSLSKSDSTEYQEILEVLQKVYLRLQKDESVEALANRLANFIYFKAYTEKIHFTKDQDKMIQKISSIGKYAGLNGSYRADYGDKSQF
ncbi:bacteriocin immunity protein [Enterococcus pallens]|uniref:Enterocin A immunity protein n=1 Tax=Enterococcus pallens ATCC BAA-351 TaxID=1158607 RepID=R2Q6B8_9ENTE|nr:bacteriocin immunity protein [Enterococcus pallens]EOH90808.1 hypothetical protein UAU_03347 [Enterococcus pallens ATCC BAA-351]EOU16004.1 hypothetical protein I588_03660 [Enterococcus pallens ATCC BAA-351]OJG76299.1 hypothetical protein RV10_GL003842 [Enterococcus pallens]